MAEYSLIYIRVAVKYQFTYVNFLIEYVSEPKIVRCLRCQTILKTLDKRWISGYILQVDTKLPPKLQSNIL